MMLGQERQGTVDTTGLLHDAYERLSQQRHLKVHDREHFLAIASMVMRRVLVDGAGARQSAKRGAGEMPVTFSSDLVGHDDGVVELLALEQALTRLAEKSERALRVVECRVFGGLIADETGVALGVSVGTVKRAWRMARAWLVTRLSD